ELAKGQLDQDLDQKLIEEGLSGEKLGITTQSKRRSSRKTKEERKGQQKPQERVEPILQEWSRNKIKNPKLEGNLNTYFKKVTEIEMRKVATY
ncbi:3574_t:CDS:2, partial [Gigaspora rosea]